MVSNEGYEYYTRSQADVSYTTIILYSGLIPIRRDDARLLRTNNCAGGLFLRGL